MGMAKPTNSALFTELWIEYAIAMLALALRFFSRWRMFGLKNFDLGDAFAGLAMVCYTLAAVGMQFAETWITGHVLTRYCRDLSCQYVERGYFFRTGAK